MKWNWQQPEWPHFSWSKERMIKAEKQFLLGAGIVLGAIHHLSDEDRDQLIVQSITEEAITSSEIEGESLNRESVQSSIRLALGLTAEKQRTSPAEKGIAEVMVDLYKNFQKPMTKETLCTWHAMLMQGQSDLQDIDQYRTHTEPMQVVSGKIYDPKVHFEAPPSDKIHDEMKAFVNWFNETSPSGANTLPALTRAGIAHLYFESIHPFEDGNGRIGRAISEKALAQSLGSSTLTALAATILLRRRSYYDMLEVSNKHSQITEWLAWFAGITLEAQQRTRVNIDFLIDITKLLDRLSDDLNTRQRKVLLRVLKEAPEGFKGGLSAGNYVSIAKTSPATARRDLLDLVKKGALSRTGERRHARYHLTIPLRPVSQITIDNDGEIISLPPPFSEE